MSDEKKTYPTYPIPISNEEYRDLITQNSELAHNVDYYRNKWWTEETAKKAAEAELSKVKANLEKFNGFIASSSEAKALFEAYLAKEALKASGGILGQLNL